MNPTHFQGTWLQMQLRPKTDYLCTESWIKSAPGEAWSPTK